MKNTLTVLAAVLVISTASAQAIAIDALNKGHLSEANLSAIAATRTYAKEPNGTTHAIADLAFCNFSELRHETRESELATEANDKQIDALKRLRARVNLPAVECVARAITAVRAQALTTDRPVTASN